MRADDAQKSRASGRSPVRPAVLVCTPKEGSHLVVVDGPVAEAEDGKGIVCNVCVGSYLPGCAAGEAFCAVREECAAALRAVEVLAEAGGGASDR